MINYWTKPQFKIGDKVIVSTTTWKRPGVWSKPIAKTPDLYGTIHFVSDVHGMLEIELPDGRRFWSWPQYLKHQTI